MAFNPFAFLSAIFLGACSVVGIRTVEEPRFELIAQIGAVEIRQYAPKLVAQTTIDADEMTARNEGFRRLAGFIFGGNTTGTSIEMTAPVAQSQGGNSSQIAMTAPVSQSKQAGGWVIRFSMPSSWTKASLPVPNDPKIEIVEQPTERWAVLRFSGSTAPEAIAPQHQALLTALATSSWQPVGDVVDWFYDPPWTLPPLRRNEAAVMVAPR